MDYKETYSRRKNFNFENTGNFQNCLFVFDYNCPEFNIGGNSKKFRKHFYGTRLSLNQS